MSEFREQPKRSFSLRQLTVSKTALLISKNRTPHIQEPLPVSLSNDILKSLKSQSSLNSTTLSMLNTEKFTITEADLSSCKLSVRSLSILLKHKLRCLSLRNTDIEESEENGDNDRANLIESLPLLSPTLIYLNTLSFTHSNLFMELMKEGKFPHLEYVSIFCNNNEDHKSLQAILKGRQSLRYLDLLLHVHIWDISFLEEVPNLETLSLLYMSKLTTDDKKMVEVLRKLSKLRSVSLRMDKIVDVFGEVFRNNSDPLWPQLQSIDLSYSLDQNGTFEEKHSMIEEIIKHHPTLEYLDITDNRDFSPSFPTSVKIANSENMKNVINSIRMPRTPVSLFFPAIHSFDMLAATILDDYDELTTDDLNEILRTLERTFKIISLNWEESFKENARTIVQVMCSKNVFRLEPQLLSRCLTALDYTSNLPKLHNLIMIKDLPDYCVLEYVDYCRAAFRYSFYEPCFTWSGILARLIPKLTLSTMHSLMNNVHNVIGRLTNIFRQENMDNKYTTIAENLLTIIVAVTGHSEEVCIWLSTRYPLQHLICLLLQKAKSYSTKIIECIVQILNNMIASIDKISLDIGGDLITALISTVSEDRLESFITRGIIEKEYDDDMIDKAIWSLICSLNQSSNNVADQLTIAAVKKKKEYSMLMIKD